jgi:hypothetical protein
MIFKAKVHKKDELITHGNRILGIGAEGDKFTIRHGEDVTQTLEEALAARLSESNGWTPDRTMRRIACVPATLLLQKPELAYDLKALKQFLKSPEGAQYATVTKGL